MKKPRRPTRPPARHYYITVYGGGNPMAVGPFSTATQRDQAVWLVRKVLSHADEIFWATVTPKGALKVGRYPADSFARRTVRP